MASDDGFIDEVTEEVRRDRLFGYVRKYGWIAASLVVLLVGGAAYNEYRKAQIRSLAEIRGDAVLAGLNGPSPADRATALSAIEADGDLAAALAMLAAAQAGDDATARAAALDRLDAAAGVEGLDPQYRDLARLKAVLLRSDKMHPEEQILLLEPLSAPGAPYRPLALEAMALAHIKAGQTDAALTLLQDLMSDSQATQGLLQRASQLIVALGGSVDGTQ